MADEKTPEFYEGMVHPNGKAVLVRTKDGYQWQKYTGKIPEGYHGDQGPSFMSDIPAMGPELARGVIGLGTSIPTMAELGARGAGWLAGKMGYPDFQEASEKFAGDIPLTYGKVSKFFDPAGEWPTPQSGVGKLVGQVLQSVPSMVGMNPTASLPSKVATAIGAGVGQELAGEAAHSWDIPEVPARLLGGVVGGAAAPTAVRGGMRGVTPYPAANKSKAALAQQAIDKGVAIPAARMVGNQELLQKEAALAPFAGASPYAKPLKQGEASKIVGPAMAKRLQAQGLLKPLPPPSTGNDNFSKLTSLITGLGGAAGMWALTHDPMKAVEGSIPGLIGGGMASELLKDYVVNPIRGRAHFSGPGQWRARNQLLPWEGPQPDFNTLIKSLMTQGSVASPDITRVTVTPADAAK